MRIPDIIFKIFNPLFAYYYNNKWLKNDIKYALISGSGEKSVRDFLKEQVKPHPIVDSIIEDKDLSKGSIEDKMYNCERFIIDNIKYISDIKNKNKREFWNTALDTFMTKKGDCEDGGILMLALARKCGVPAWRIKLCAGWVHTDEGIKEGHAYIIFLDNNLEWKICDWCFYPVKKVYKTGKEAFENRVKHSNNDNYDEIWFTVNDKYGWAQHSTTINNLKDGDE